MFQLKSMSFFQKNHTKSSFSIIAIIFIIAIICGSIRIYNRLQLKSYGVQYNHIREKIGLPLIGANWEEIYSEDEINFVNPRVESSHRRKRVVPVNEGLPDEADLFFLPLDRGTIDMQFHGSISESKAMLFRNGRRIVIPYKQGIDTLKKYSIL